jgi:hypothetical protein
LLEVHTAIGQLSQCDHFGLVGVDQPALLATESVQAGSDVALLGLLALVTLERGLRQSIELRQQTRGVFQQTSDVAPDRVFEFGGLHGSARACPLASADDAIFAVAGVVLTRWLARRRAIRAAEHGQATRAARQQATQQVVVVRVASEREHGVARELFQGALGDCLVEDGRYRNGDPLVARSGLAAARLSSVRSARCPRPLGWHVAIAVRVGSAGVNRVGQDVVHGRG